MWRTDVLSITNLQLLLENKVILNFQIILKSVSYQKISLLS